MPTRTNISDMVIGQVYSNVFLLKQHAIKLTKTGSNYIDMVIQDKTGELPCKLWTIPTNLEVDKIQDSDFIVVQFTVEDYQGNKQGKVSNMRLVTPADEGKFNKEDLIPMAPESAENMYNELLSTAQGFTNSDLRKVVTTALRDNKVELMTMPGAKSMHHAILSGLLYHTVGMLRTGKAICSVNKAIKQDLLCAGIILHDIAKLKEFSTGPVGLVVDYSPEGKLLGHIHMGAKYIGDLCEQLKVDEEIKMLLEHMILSHHGIPEHGSAVMPMFLEAEILHYCDNIDARIYMFNDAVKDIAPGEFSPKVFGLDNRQIYKMKYEEDVKPTDNLSDDGLY